MKSSVRPESTTTMDYSALISTRPDSTYKSGKVVQTSGATSQSVAESYINLAREVNPLAVLNFDQVLNAGGNHPVFNANGTGATKLTSEQITWFTTNYDIALHVRSQGQV